MKGWESKEEEEALSCLFTFNVCSKNERNSSLKISLFFSSGNFNKDFCDNFSNKSIVSKNKNKLKKKKN